MLSEKRMKAEKLKKKNAVLVVIHSNTKQKKKALFLAKQRNVKKVISAVDNV